ncbi:MAG: VOC family protein [Rhodospirillales bacterium]|nr:VOC family protein [Rhodospirillales bacterium]
MAGKLRHIAISVPDPDEAAKFYEKTFGFTRAGEYDADLATVVYLTDGVMSLTLLKFKSEVMSGKDTHPEGLGKEFVGLHHIGFWVDDVEKSGKAAEENGGVYIMGEVPGKAEGYYEVKYRDPNGVMFDITHSGWAGAAKEAGAADAS